ncbi:hypothetical protein BSPWISOXPB_4366 [uncultured Gammaproteobacteria bacterium]|nr:hypothetical protein BSPWISOXPB_4366 [uncultured Gammaproteobacteria bacterium]
MFATGQTRNKIDEIYDDDDLSEDSRYINNVFWRRHERGTLTKNA